MDKCKSCGDWVAMKRLPQSNAPYCPECNVLQESPNYGNQGWEA